MAFWHAAILVVSLVVIDPVAGFAATMPELPESVPAEDYALYDLAVEDKFLTSGTKLVVIERMTARYLHPDEPHVPTVAWFAEQDLFDRRLPQDLIRDFVAKSQRSSRLETRFGFGVRYRFVSGEGVPDAETALLRIPVAQRVQEERGVPDIIDRLAFSRVGFTLRGDQALLYVANPRPDGTGAGFLLWFIRQHKGWRLYDTEVLWVSRPEEKGSGGRK
ncbi:MAG TPA: hypothetical protein DCQ94_13285 [Nitrospira sp.]|jgi:hypothetical protein|nr:hypothetical protein [Nitrospira sp.]